MKWNRKKVLAELRRLRRYWNVEEQSLASMVDYITLHPNSVRRDFFNALMKEEVRNETR